MTGAFSFNQLPVHTGLAIAHRVHGYLGRIWFNKPLIFNAAEKMNKQNLISTFLFLVTTVLFAAFVNGHGKSKDSIQCFELRTNLKG